MYDDRPFGFRQWSVDETMAFLLSVKIRHGLSDEAFFALLEGENASMDPKTVGRLLPVSQWRTGKEIQGFLPFHYKYVTYCPSCSSIIGRSSELVKEGICGTCGSNFSDVLSQGGGHFIVFPVRKQIEAYCTRPKFQALVRKFKGARFGKVQGPLHRGVIDKGHLSVTVATDGAVLSKWSNTTLFPIVLFFNNIPVSYQVVYPVLCALYCGPTRFSPPRHVFFKYLVDELRELEENPIFWKYDTGMPVRSLSYVTLCCSDAPEKAKLMNHKGHGGYYSCPYCKYKGELVVKDPSSVFPPRPSGKKAKKPRERRKSGGNENPNKESEEGTQGTSNAPNQNQKRQGGKVKFPKLNHKQPIFPIRDPKERIRVGEELVKKLKEKGETETEEKEGVLGIGVLNDFARFNETLSHTPGLLHLVCEGIFKDIMNLVVWSEGDTYSLKKKGGNWDTLERQLESRTKVSEANYNCKSPRIYSSWRAYDYYQLLVHDVVLFFSDEKIITDEEFQKVIFLLSDCMYLLCHGRMDDNIRRLARERVQEFSEAYVSFFGPEWCTYKFHVFQHTPDIVDQHGPAFLWDDFNLERINHLTKETVTATRGQMSQIGTHFLLKHHSDVLQDPSVYSESVRDQLKKNGFHQEVFFTYEDFVTHTAKEPLDLNVHEAVVGEMINKNYCDVGDTPEFNRVTRMIRKNVVVLTSKHFKHRGSVRDSYVQVDGDCFGQIIEIVYCVDIATYFLVIEKFQKYDALYAKGNRILHPCYQVPYKRTGFLRVIELTDELFIQKAQISCLVCCDGTVVNVFSPRPNEFFRF